MTDDVKITGTEDVVDLARALKRLGDTTIIPTLRREINASTKDERRAIRDAIRGSQLPQRGGLAAWVARTPSMSTKVERDRASIKLKLQRRGHDLEAINRGRLRRLVFGHHPWVTQEVSAHWWERAVEPRAHDVQTHVAEALSRAVERAVEHYKGGEQ